MKNIRRGGVVVAVLMLSFVSAASGQKCVPTSLGDGRIVGVEQTSMEIISGSRNCQGFWRCERPMVGEPAISSVTPDATPGEFTVEMRASLQIPGNIQQTTDPNTQARIGRSVGIWFDGETPTFPCFPGNCANFLSRCGGLPGIAMTFDVGDAFMQISGISCATLDTDSRLRTYTFDLYACDISGCQLRTNRQFDFSASNLAEKLRCEPPRESCDNCNACPIGGGGAPGGGCSGSPQAPGKCGGGGGGGVGAGMSVAGDGISLTLPGSGSGAILRYRARGPGDAGHAIAGLPGLGRYWSHDAAERVISFDPGVDQFIGLVTRNGTVHVFEDIDGDSSYEVARPSDDYRQVTKTVTGWEIRFLDGTIQRHDVDGLWTETVDPNGNTTTASYAGGDLISVSFPDGRGETFAYDGAGLLDTMTEVGVDGLTTRVWSYDWTVDGDLERVDRPDGTAWVLFYQDIALPGYLTRVELEGTDNASRRIMRAWRYDAMGNAVATWRGALLDTDPGAIDGWAFDYNRPVAPTETTVTDPFGKDSVYTFNYDSSSAKPRVTKIDGDCPTCGTGPNSQFFYDDGANPLLPTRVVDGRGTTTMMSYDANGLMTSRVEAMGETIERETTWQYDPTFPALATTVSQPSTTGNINDFRITSTTYNATGDAVTRTISGFEDGFSFNLPTTTTFTVQGLPDTVDPPGFVATDITDFDYNDATRGNVVVTSRTDPLVGTTTFDYDAFNRRTSITDPNNVTSETEYDLLNRVTKVIQRGAFVADDLVTEHRYTIFGDLFQTILPEGNVIEYGYDPVGRLTSIERKADDQATTHGERSLFTLNSFGHRIRQDLQRWDPVGLVWDTQSATESVYATRCFLDQTIEGAGSGNESVTEFAYDCEGNLERIWDANHPSAGQTQLPSTTHVYDALNRLTEIRQPFGSTGTNAITLYGYDTQDHLDLVTDAEGTVTSYAYSDRDLLTTETSEVSGTKAFVYNEHGELTEETDARLIVTTRTVDELDRVTMVDYPDNTLDITYTYDDAGVPFSLGRLTAITRNGTSIAYGYDRFGRLTQDGALTFAYDMNGNRSTIGYPGGVATTSTYDFADRPETMTATVPSLGGVSLVTATSYLPSGPIEGLTLGNSIVETRLHDARYHPDRIMAAPGVGPSLLDWDYTTDDVGNIASIADVLVPARNRTYGYQDHQYFLTQGDGPWGTLAWTYDQIGNRLTETRDAGTADAYTYVPNAAGGNSPMLAQIALGAGGTQAFQFDAAGNQTQIADGSILDSGFDDASRQASVGDSVFLVENRYDGRGFLQRSERTYPGALFADGFEGGSAACWSATVGGGGGGTCPADPLSVNPTYSSDGLLHHLVRGLGDDERWVLYHAGRPVALVEQRAGGSAEITYLTTDHLGTPVLAMDGGGVELWGGGFEPFGADFADADEAGVFLRFPGQWVDGLMAEGGAYNVNRWFSVDTGMYSRADPLGVVSLDTFSFRQPAGRDSVRNLYAYGISNPILVIDPFGLKSRVCCRGIPATGNIFKHCYLDVRDEVSGLQTTFGVHGGFFQGSSDVGSVIENAQFDRAGKGKCGGWSEACETDECVKQQATNYPSPNRYKLIRGPNSNTFAGTVSRACGLSPPKVAGTRKTPGWSDSPAPPAPEQE